MPPARTNLEFARAALFHLDIRAAPRARYRLVTSMKSIRQKRRPFRAFTLIELLVVVAIIALLISILLPALGQARERGKRTVCLSQLRELTTALRQYADEYRIAVSLTTPTIFICRRCGRIT